MAENFLLFLPFFYVVALLTDGWYNPSGFVTDTFPLVAVFFSSAATESVAMDAAEKGFQEEKDDWQRFQYLIKAAVILSMHSTAASKVSFRVFVS